MNLMVWGTNVQNNLAQLQRLHSICTEWAQQNNVEFGPEKYQLIHLAKTRANRYMNAAFTAGTHTIVPQKTTRILGVTIDQGLRWQEHIKQTACKGQAAYLALARLMGSTWGPKWKYAKLLYTAAVRPILTYAAPIWSISHAGEPQPQSKLLPLIGVQNRCLRLIMGGYKRTPQAALERESGTLPLPLHLHELSRQYAGNTHATPPTAQIQDRVRRAWHQYRPVPYNQPPASGLATLRGEWQRTLCAGLSLITPKKYAWERANKAWQAQWEHTGENRQGTTWLTPWHTPPIRLYSALKKVEATALFLLRTEIIGLNEWLSRVRVPGISPQCPCGWHAQTVPHILLHCPRYQQGRTQILTLANSTNMTNILTRIDSAHAAARWLVKCGVLQQFNLARQDPDADVYTYTPWTRRTHARETQDPLWRQDRTRIPQTRIC
jgi:hypothetical protein